MNQTLIILSMFFIFSLSACSQKDKEKPLIEFGTEYDYQRRMGNPVVTDSNKSPEMFKKQLATSLVGSPVRMNDFFVSSYDGADWEKGGKLHVFNDYSLGEEYAVRCSLNPNDGDKIMKHKKRISIDISGVISSYSSSRGLVIDPCMITHDKQTSTERYETKSRSTEFCGAKLGGKVKDFMFGEPLEMDGGPYFFTKNKAQLSYFLDDGVDPVKNGSLGKITAITFECREGLFPQSTGQASIDGVSCESSISKLEEDGWKKLCRIYHFDSYDKPFDKVYLKANSFVKVSADSIEIKSFGIYTSPYSFDRGYRNCNEADQMKKRAKERGFETLGHYVRESEGKK